MKTFGILAASAAALLVGAKLVLAAFAPVLPPEFDRRRDPHFTAAYWSATWHSDLQIERFRETGRWATSVEELVRGARYEEWGSRDPEGWRRFVDGMREEITFERIGEGRSVVTYMSRERPEEWEGPPGRVSCTVTLDAAIAVARAEWRATPRGRRGIAPPPAAELWPRMDCRRLSGLRGTLPVAGLDRYREPPAERYAPLTYAERAWERAGIGEEDAAGAPR